MEGEGPLSVLDKVWAVARRQSETVFFGTQQSELNERQS
jgi:hypothetical protein